MVRFDSNATDLAWQPLAIPAVTLLISFLGYSSQLLFYVAENVEPGPLTIHETCIFNFMLACIWCVYYKACTVDPGRFLFPGGYKSSTTPASDVDGEAVLVSESGDADTEIPLVATSPRSRQPRVSCPADEDKPLQPLRWCRKCNAPKAARAHHCRHCQRCIPRMDHHCPWTTNCVSYTTFPHFMRFLFYTNLTLLYFLIALLLPRFVKVYERRNLPYYLGPSVFALVHLVLLAAVGAVTEFLLMIMLVSTVKNMAVNVTMIEGWEIEKHEANQSRAATGRSAAISPHPNDEGSDYDEEENHVSAAVEFPYDIGIFSNIAQAMGSHNPVMWLLPVFGSSTAQLGSNQSELGWSWPENGFNADYGLWPPLDSLKEQRAGRVWSAEEEAERKREFENTYKGMSNEDVKSAFRARQQADFMRRRDGTSSSPSPPST